MIKSSGKFSRGYKGGRRSSDVNSRPSTDAYRKGWDATFGKQQQPKQQQKETNG